MEGRGGGGGSRGGGVTILINPFEVEGVSRGACVSPGGLGLNKVRSEQR